jgi:hypothetical protein
MSPSTWRRRPSVIVHKEASRKRWTPAVFASFASWILVLTLAPHPQDPSCLEMQRLPVALERQITSERQGLRGQPLDAPPNTTFGWAISFGVVACAFRCGAATLAHVATDRRMRRKVCPQVLRRQWNFGETASVPSGAISLGGREAARVMPKCAALWSALVVGITSLALPTHLSAIAEESITITTLLKDGWQIAGYTTTLDNRSAFILFRNPKELFLVQCRAAYDVTRKPSVTSNCYRLQ